MKGARQSLHIVLTRRWAKIACTVAVIKNDGIPVVRLALNNQEIIVSSKSQEVGSSKENLIYEKHEGEPLTISFSGKYVYDAIRFLDCPQIVVDFTTDMKPFVIRNPEDDSIIQLILPVRTYN